MSSSDLLRLYCTLAYIGNIVTNLTDPATPSQNSQGHYSTLSYVGIVVGNLTTAPQSNQSGLSPWEGAGSLISPQARDSAVLILRCGLQMIVLMFGIPGNVLNLAVFAKVSNEAG